MNKKVSSKILPFCVAVAAAVQIGAAQAAESAPKATGSKAIEAAGDKADANSVSVGVVGMTCADCKKKVEGELAKLKSEGKWKGKVGAIAVDLAQKKATVRLLGTTTPLAAAERALLRQDVEAAITRAGFEPVKAL